MNLLTFLVSTFFYCVNTTFIFSISCFTFSSLAHIFTISHRNSFSLRMSISKYLHFSFSPNEYLSLAFLSDIKPDNVMLSYVQKPNSRDFEVIAKIADFGLAKAAHGASDLYKTHCGFADFTFYTNTHLYILIYYLYNLFILSINRHFYYLLQFLL